MNMTPEEEGALWLRHQIQIRGKDDPARVPLRVGLSSVVWRAEWNRDPRLADSDIEHLRGWEDKLTPGLLAAYATEVPAFAEAGDPLELARLVTELRRKDYEERERLHWEFLNQLTPEGRAVILEMISNAHPNFSEVDYLGMAKEAPEYFRQMILESCRDLFSDPPEGEVVWKDEPVMIRSSPSGPVIAVLAGSGPSRRGENRGKPLEDGNQNPD